MPSLSFEGDTHQELVAKVRRWLQSAEEAEGPAHLTPVEAVDRGAELTRAALRTVAAVAPEPVASSELTHALTDAGYRVTETTRQVVVGALDVLAELTDGGLVKKAEDARKSAVYEMNTAVARQLLKALRG